MKRTPEPHGTKAAYMRHWRANEEACGPCKEANARQSPRRPAREANPRNREQTAYDKAIAANPPKILWVKSSKGIFVAAKVIDPHAEAGQYVPVERCKNDHVFDAENTVWRADGSRECRACKRQRDREYFARKRAENSPLVAAARTDI